MRSLYKLVTGDPGESMLRKMIHYNESMNKIIHNTGALFGCTCALASLASASSFSGTALGITTIPSPAQTNLDQIESVDPYAPNRQQQ